MKNQPYKKIIENLLVDQPSLRDDDLKLYKALLDKLNFDVVKSSAHDLIEKTNNKLVPLFTTVVRLRSRLQQLNSSLRGVLWDERHGIKQQKALSDLGYVSTY